MPRQAGLFPELESDAGSRAASRRPASVAEADACAARAGGSAGKEPVLVSLCFLGVPCRWHGRRAKRRDKLLADLKEKFVLVPVCPEQLGGLPTPRSGETLQGRTGADVLDRGYHILAPGTGRDMTDFHVNGSRATLEIARLVGATRAYLKSGSPTCDRDGVTGEVLRRGGVRVIRVG